MIINLIKKKMKSIILIFISLIISSLSVEPIYPEPYHIIGEYKLNEPILKGPKSPNNYKITKLSQKTTFLEDGEFTELIFTLKAVNIIKGIYLESFKLKFQNKAKIIKHTASFNKKRGKYIFRNNEFNFMFKLSNNEDIDIHLKYQTRNPQIFELYRCEYIQLPVFNLGYYESLYIKGSGKVTIIGTKLGHFIKNKENNTYYWKGIVKSTNISDYIFIGYKTAKWKGSITGMIKSNQNINTYAEFRIFPYFLGGNNKIHNYDVSNGISRKFDGENIIQKDNEIIFKSKMKNNYAYFKIESTFSNFISSNWKLRTTFSKKNQIKNINLFKQKAKEILSRDKSKNPDYIKIGRWVNLNIKYDYSYLGKKIPVEEILKIRKGVCEHYTLLYNALLNSIGIDTIYVRGYAFQKKEDLKINNNNIISHAWTIAKINNNWIPLDSTWGILEGKLPVTHVFIEYEKNGILFIKCKGCVQEIKQDIKFLGFDESMIRKKSK